MNLEGKYIEINLKNVKQVVTFLYSIGYDWAENGLSLNVSIIHITSLIKEYNAIYFECINEKEFWIARQKSNKYCFLDIKKLMREDKLKRVLNGSI